jgi:hypothetical protein
MLNLVDDFRATKFFRLPVVEPDCEYYKRHRSHDDAYNDDIRGHFIGSLTIGIFLLATARAGTTTTPLSVVLIADILAVCDLLTAEMVAEMAIQNSDAIPAAVVASTDPLASSQITPAVKPFSTSPMMGPPKIEVRGSNILMMDDM